MALEVLAPALAVFAPRPEVRLLDWAREYARDEWGHPYDDDAFPHLGAPGGPLDALDCRQYLDVWLQWATRLGKSFGGQIQVLKNADVDPCPMLFISADAMLAKQAGARTRRMIEHCPQLARQLPARKSKTEIELDFCRLFIGWPRSPATLADKAIRFGHAAEIDKYEYNPLVSKEADPLELFDERFKEFAWFKRLKESSPGLRSASRIEPGRLAGTNARYFVQCQRCKKLAPLAKEQIRFERPAGRADKELARRTAYYQCPLCGKANRDEDRGPMMRCGVWVPEGCDVHHKRAIKAAARQREAGRPLWRGFTQDADWLIGTPARDGTSYSSHLSSLYALSVTWGAIAEKIVDSEQRPGAARNFKNSWLAETWEHVRRDTDWETLGKRLMITPLERGQVPREAWCLFAGVDKQESVYPVTAGAWTEHGARHVLDYARLESIEDLLDWLSCEFPGEGGKLLRLSLVLMDFGYRPHGVHDVVEKAKARGIRLIPCRGSTSSLGVPYRRRRLGKDTSKPGARYIEVDTSSTQDWLDKQLHDLVPGGDGGMTLFSGPLAEHQELLAQVLNDAPVPSTDRNNQVRESWKRIDESLPNDYRDCLRYESVAYLLKKNRHDGFADDAPTSWFASQPGLVRGGRRR